MVLKPKNSYIETNIGTSTKTVKSIEEGSCLLSYCILLFVSQYSKLIYSLWIN